MASKDSVTVETKYIIDELNSLLNKNYNMLSLDSMSRIETLQLICNVLQRLEVLDNAIVVTDKSIDQGILDILQALNSIKYVPESTGDPTEFRNGLAMANHNVTNSLLGWLLANKSQVKRRAYIAKYVEKVPIPLELMQDAQVYQLSNSYEMLIQDFWRSYEVNKYEKRNAYAARELKHDISKMTSDLQYLTQLMQKQKDKVNNISNKEAFIVSTKSYLAETKSLKKLDNQLKNIQETLNSLESEIKNSRDALNAKKLLRPSRTNILQEISEELHINKILTETQLPEERLAAESELHIYETVSFEADPIQFDIDSLTREMESLTMEVKTLVSQKIGLTNMDTDNLAPFRNQAAIIANKKQEISSIVMELKSNLEKLYESIEDKKQMLYSLVGGEVLHGEELKQFITKLRERSVLYKQYRSRLHSLTEELSLLGRTYDIMLLHEPSITNTEELTQTNNNNINNNSTETVQDLQEAKIKLRMTTQSLELTKAEAAQSREELNNMRAIMQNVNENYEDVLKEFEKSTGSLTTKIEVITETKDKLKSEIKKKEDYWKQIYGEIDKNEKIMIKLGEDIISSIDEGATTLTDQLKKMLEEERKREQKLKMELANSDESKNINELQLEIIRKLIALLNSIWDE